MFNRCLHLFIYLTLSLVSSGLLANSDLSLSNTSSPQKTLASFMFHSETLIDHWRQEQLQEPEARHAYVQTMRTLDLSLVPNRTRTVVVMEKIVQLREIIERLDQASHASAPTLVNAGELQQWRFANTDIVIKRQMQGNKADQFLFSASTIQNLSRWYETISVLPYSSDYRFDYYQEFLRSPGPLFSKAYIESLPAFMNALHGPLPLWQWLAVSAVILLCLGMIKVSFVLGVRWDSRFGHKGLKWKIGRMLSLNTVVLILLLARRLIDDGIWITGSVYQLFSTSFLLVQFFALSLLIMAFFNYFAEIYAFNKHNGKRVDSSLITVLARILGGFTIAILGIYIIGYMGFSISPIVAGLGVGGLAVALAIRPLLENVINGLTLYADGGIKIGELCRYGERLGVIESIGLRSTRIRTLERSLITIPNSEFANMEIDNLERRDKRRMEHILRLRPEITMEQLRVLIANIRRVLLQHPMIEEDPIRVRFMGVGEYSMNVNIMGYISCRDNEEFMAVQEDILFAMMQQVGEVGVKIAHSTQYQLIDKQDSVSLAQQLKANEIVEKWHDEEDFPFPDFSFEYKCEIKDATVYPAKTSAVRQYSLR